MTVTVTVEDAAVEATVEDAAVEATVAEAVAEAEMRLRLLRLVRQKMVQVALKALVQSWIAVTLAMGEMNSILPALLCKKRNREMKPLIARRSSYLSCLLGTLLLAC